MNKYDEFIEYFKYLRAQGSEIEPSGVDEVLQALKELSLAEKSKPLLTDSGLKILQYLQSCSAEKLKAADIAQGMDVSSRKVTGAIRKLVEDGFVSKFGQSPVQYSLTERGKEFNINEYKENLNKN